MFKSKVQPHCMCCGRPIKKVTDRTPFSGHSFSKGPVVRTKAEAQRYVNQPIVAISYRKIYDHDVGELKVVDRVVATASTWDGESYEDGWFCNGTCRTKWAYATARFRHPNGYLP